VDSFTALVPGLAAGRRRPLAVAAFVLPWAHGGGGLPLRTREFDAAWRGKVRRIGFARIVVSERLRNRCTDSHRR
jgi:hypothetical protein